MQSASIIQLVGAGAFGMLIGWYIYFINRYHVGNVQLSDLASLVGIIGGGAILNIFKSGSDLFGAYGIGLAVGFFGYFATLIIMVCKSKNFNFDWFLDGRRKNLANDESIPGTTVQFQKAMAAVPVHPKENPSK